MIADEFNQPIVKVPEAESEAPYYNALLYYDAFSSGFKISDYWENTTECYFRYTNFTYLQRPLWEETRANPNISRYDKVDNTTNLLSNSSLNLQYCVNMTWSFDNFLTDRKELFSHSWGNFFAGFFNNLLTNVISMNNIYTSITEN